MKAFTLIKLLIVISVMGVLAGAVVVAMNPSEKINAANDARVKSDISAMVTAMQTFVINNNGRYPDGNSPTLASSGCASGNATTILGGTGGLIANKDLSSIPVPPSGYNTSYSYCWNNALTPPRAKITGEQKKGGSTTYFAWCSWTGGTASGATYNLNTANCP